MRKCQAFLPIRQAEAKKVFFRGAPQLVLSSGAYMRPEYDACGLNRRNMLIIKEDGL